jgi:hypothetical protein
MIAGIVTPTPKAIDSPAEPAVCKMLFSRMVASLNPKAPQELTFVVLSAWLERRPADMLEGLEVLGDFAVFDDPEAIFQEGWLLCDVGEHARGVPFLERALARGYFAAPTLERSSQFDALRHNPSFQSLLADAQAGRDRALAAFRQAGGERLLGR